MAVHVELLLRRSVVSDQEFRLAHKVTRLLARSPGDLHKVGIVVGFRLRAGCKPAELQPGEAVGSLSRPVLAYLLTFVIDQELMILSILTPCSWYCNSPLEE